ncbi:HdeD family acid-resistance protein [Altericroceibacterium spongiae]|uniref:HdeD family acid-resistance protein n=1 Tax=Altericroceibacterium spongiae TaxID=2320269 RepID=A0A420ERC8_9SPHN|nr:DUF308 domain-containing protein [Altericroceibacterium spongiae]RKF23221.1 HdeD family acid-resistance protein [Altericroceibacterium spongiae]
MSDIPSSDPLRPKTGPDDKPPYGESFFVGGFLGLSGHNWSWIAVRGVFALLLGIAALFAPGFTLFAFALVFAAFSFVDGIAMLITGFRRPNTHSGRWWALILSGLAGVAVGVLFIVWPLATTFAYALLTVMLIIGWALLTGVLEIAASMQLRKEVKGEWLMALSGVFSVLLGLALLWLVFANPAITILSVAWLIALYAFMSGITLLVLAFKLRKHANSNQ